MASMDQGSSSPQGGASGLRQWRAQLLEVPGRAPSGPYAPVCERLAQVQAFLGQALPEEPLNAPERLWFLGTLPAWGLALQSLSAHGEGQLPGVGGSVIRLASAEDWVLNFANAWLDPAMGALSQLARGAMEGSGTDLERRLGQLLTWLLQEGLPGVLLGLGYRLVETMPFATPFDDSVMICDSTLPVPGLRNMVVGVNRVGIVAGSQVLREPHVVVGG